MGKHARSGRGSTRPRTRHDGCPSAGERRRMNLERNKAIVERYYGELNRGNLAIVDELIDPDYVAHDPNLPADLREGIRNLKRVIERSRIGFPDQRIEMDDIIAEGDRVACRLKFYGHLASEWDGA